MTLVSINSTVAYFSMEICLEQAVPTYSGGLGVLAGDTLRSAADLGVPMVGITLLHRKGYFEQHLDTAGAQTEQPVTWQPDEILDLLPVNATVQIEGRPVRVRAWRHIIRGAAAVPLRERRGDEASRSVAGDVSAVSDQLDHQRGPCVNVDLAGFSVAVRPPHSRVARRQLLPPLRHRHSAPGDSPGTRRREARASR